MYDVGLGARHQPGPISGHGSQVPTTFVFSAMLFGATLLDRAVITSTFFGVVFGGFVAGTVVVNVIVQELHIP